MHAWLSSSHPKVMIQRVDGRLLRCQACCRSRGSPYRSSCDGSCIWECFVLYPASTSSSLFYYSNCFFLLKSLVLCCRNRDHSVECGRCVLKWLAQGVPSVAATLNCQRLCTLYNQHKRRQSLPCFWHTLTAELCEVLASASHSSAVTNLRDEMLVYKPQVEGKTAFTDAMLPKHLRVYEELAPLTHSILNTSTKHDT
jgi:hypothetical protein